MCGNGLRYYRLKEWSVSALCSWVCFSVFSLKQMLGSSFLILYVPVILCCILAPWPILSCCNKKQQPNFILPFFLKWGIEFDFFWCFPLWLNVASRLETPTKLKISQIKSIMFVLFYTEKNKHVFFTLRYNNANHRGIYIQQVQFGQD